MKSKVGNFVMLVAMLLAFTPVVAVNFALNSYVRARQTSHLQDAIDSATAQIQTAAYDGIGSLRRILANSPSLCTPTFISNVHKEMQKSLHLKEVLVENADGVQYCDAFGQQVNYAPLSGTLSIPGHTETFSVVKLAGAPMPMLKLTQAFGAERKVSVFVPVLANAADELLNTVMPASMVRISLTDGTPVLSVGDTMGFVRAKNPDRFITVQSYAGELPLRAQAAVPFAVVRAGYANLDLALTLVACAMSAIFLLAMLQYARRSNLPAFDLERAIVHGELKPYYQPVINLKTGRLAGCEMLCRWEKRNGEIVFPGAFIEYAEITGLALPMTLSLMQQVRADLGDLCRAMPDIKVSMNLFEGHFRDGSIVEDVQAIFGGSPINFRQLVFEITERRPIGNSAQANSVIAGLHALGSRLALDDTGTGHSNLAYLHTLGVDVIKIDRMFVDMIKPDTTQVPILDGLIAMARDLNTEIIAEGVETEAQAVYLRARGVVMAQGFLFAPALKARSFKQLAQALNGKDQAGDADVANAA